jgi:hypothetical protein
MPAAHDLVVPELSRTHGMALFVAGLTVALLGLTVLDTRPSRADKVHAARSSRTVDCIVASALFAGVPAP